MNEAICNFMFKNDTEVYFQLQYLGGPKGTRTGNRIIIAQFLVIFQVVLNFPRTVGASSL